MSEEISNKVSVVLKNEVMIITIKQAQYRNAVNGPTANQLADAFREFEANTNAKVAVLCGEGDTFCAGANLKAIAEDPKQANQLKIEGDGPMGPSRMQLSKPVIAAIEGYAVAGGLELACWCDLRVIAEDAILGVFCRRFGVPLIDGGTVRLPRLIGMSRALDLILTGRSVAAEEALQIGLANRISKKGQALSDAVALAQAIADHPNKCMLSDRQSAYEQWALSDSDAIKNEFELGLKVVESGETLQGASAFSKGKGRHGAF